MSGKGRRPPVRAVRGPAGAADGRGSLTDVSLQTDRRPRLRFPIVPQDYHPHFHVPPSQEKVARDPLPHSLGTGKRGLSRGFSLAPPTLLPSVGQRPRVRLRCISPFVRGARADQHPAVPVPFHMATWETPTRCRSPRQPGRLLPMASAIQPLPSPVPSLLWLPPFHTPAPLAGGPIHTPRRSPQPRFLPAVRG